MSDAVQFKIERHFLLKRVCKYVAEQLRTHRQYELRWFVVQESRNYKSCRRVYVSTW